MKLAEALSLRADLQKRLAQLKVRIKNAAKIQEGDTPAEDPKEMMQEYLDGLSQLEGLIVRINKTNQETTMADGHTLMEKIAHRDILTKQVSMQTDTCNYLTETTNRYSRKEIKYVNVLDAAAIRKQADECSKRLREVDVEIQAANWTIELCE